MKKRGNGGEKRSEGYEKRGTGSAKTAIATCRDRKIAIARKGRGKKEIEREGGVSYK